MIIPTGALAPTLHTWLHQGWRQVSALAFPSRGWSICPRPDLADVTHAGALLAGLKGAEARTLAQAWLAALPAHPWVSEVSVAGPGHLNVKVSEAGWQALLDGGVASFEPVDSPLSTLIEFVSANPTGPLHLGHARQAVLGDVLARLVRRLGGQVATEFFYNDAGVQMEHLTESLVLRVAEAQGAALMFEREGAVFEHLGPGELWFPQDGYHGQDLVEIARHYLACGGDPQDKASLRFFGVAAIQTSQQQVLDDLDVHFDARVSETDLHAQGAVAAVVQGLMSHAYQATHARQDSAPQTPVAPAWFLDTVRFGDDKDRVMVKADGSATYFIPDVAYHLDKWSRGWMRAINVQGSDHHGTLRRVQAGVQYLIPEAGDCYPQVMFHSMVKVVQQGQVVQASKRAGDMVTAREMLDVLGRDALRMALLDKRTETEVRIDVDVWTQPGAANPVYSVQYAHARVISTLDKVVQTVEGPRTDAPWTLAERRLLAQLATWPTRLDKAGVDLDPVRAATLVRELAGVVHEAYQQGPKLMELGGAARAARVRLFMQVAQTLREGGQVLGCSWPDRMPERLVDPGAAPGRHATLRP